MMETNGMLNIHKNNTTHLIIHEKPMLFKHRFFYIKPPKLMNMKVKIISFLSVLFIIFAISCEEKQPQIEHKIDLFAGEREEGKAYVMNEEECFEASEIVISTSKIKLEDSFSGRGKPIFIYKVDSGNVLKTTRDSVITYPLQFLSNQKLTFKKDSSVYVYLKKLEGFRFIAEEKHLKYQWVKGASAFEVKK